jgi:hypothetical protein
MFNQGSIEKTSMNKKKDSTCDNWEKQYPLSGNKRKFEKEDGKSRESTRRTGKRHSTSTFLSHTLGIVLHIPQPKHHIFQTVLQSRACPSLAKLVP